MATARVPVNINFATKVMTLPGVSEEVVESVMQYRRDIGNITFDTVSSNVIYGLPYSQELINSVMFVDNPNYHTNYQVTSMELDPISKLSTANTA